MTKTFGASPKSGFYQQNKVLNKLVDTARLAVQQLPGPLPQTPSSLETGLAACRAWAGTTLSTWGAFAVSCRCLVMSYVLIEFCFPAFAQGISRHYFILGLTQIPFGECVFWCFLGFSNKLSFVFLNRARTANNLVQFTEKNKAKS